MARLGVLCSPYDAEAWQAATGFRPEVLMVFEHWDQQRPLDETFAMARALGYKRMMITWEPWTPTPAGVDNATQGVFQPDWSNESIAAGAHNDYIQLMGRSIRESGLERVYIRWGHEMNGDWYPWRITPETYVKAFQRIANSVRSRAANARFIWSPNGSLYQDQTAWLNGVLPYYPGENYVDYVGLTAINTGTRNNTWADFAARFEMCHDVFKKRLVASEVNCSWENRGPFFADLAKWVAGNDTLALVVLSQPKISLQQANNTQPGQLQWTIVQDADVLANVKKIAETS